jgi:hypothetical protein
MTFDSNFSIAPPRKLNRRKLKWNMNAAKAGFATPFIASHILNAMETILVNRNPLEKVEFTLSCGINIIAQKSNISS